MRVIVSATVLAAFALVSAQAASADPHPMKAGDLVISQRVVRATFGRPATSAAYMTIANHGAAPDRLVSASCACAAQVEAHQSLQMGGMMSMNSAGPVSIPAHATVSFNPGGLHLMLMGLTAPLKDGGDQKITLVFERAGKVSAHFDIKAVIPVGGAQH